VLLRTCPAGRLERAGERILVDRRRGVEDAGAPALGEDVEESARRCRRGVRRWCSWSSLKKDERTVCRRDAIGPIDATVFIDVAVPVRTYEFAGGGRMPLELLMTAPAPPRLVSVASTTIATADLYVERGDALDSLALQR
jgi:hypothetical protein